MGFSTVTTPCRRIRFELVIAESVAATIPVRWMHGAPQRVLGAYAGKVTSTNASLRILDDDDS